MMRAHLLHLKARPILESSDGRTLLYHEVIAEAGVEAPWLVFVHGAGGSIRTWKYQIDAFKPHYRLLLIDLRDHGYSKDILPEFPEYDFDIVAEDILAVIDHLGIGRAHFVSLSIGSVILQKLDIERPELIDRMVMAGAIFDGSRLMHLFVHSGTCRLSMFHGVDALSGEWEWHHKTSPRASDAKV